MNKTDLAQQAEHIEQTRQSAILTRGIAPSEPIVFDEVDAFSMTPATVNPDALTLNLPDDHTGTINSPSRPFTIQIKFSVERAQYLLDQTAAAIEALDEYLGFDLGTVEGADALHDRFTSLLSEMTDIFGLPKD